MEKNSTNQDILGNKFGERYSTFLVDPAFEARLRLYDPQLKLMFDQVTKRWVILVWAEDNSGWQILMKCEDDFGNPMPLGDHVFTHLNWMRRQYEEKRKSPTVFLDSLIEKAEAYKEKRSKELSEEAQYRVRHDISQWRKAFNNHSKLSPSDAIAGYPTKTYKPKGIVCRPT